MGNRNGWSLISLISCLFLLAALVRPAIALDFRPAEKDGLHAQIELYSKALMAQDLETVVKTVPPRILQSMADETGVSLDLVRAATKAQLQMVLAAVTITGFTMHQGQISFAAAADGTPCALIPTTTIMKIGDQTIEGKSHTFAMIDDGQWYLLRVSDEQQVAIMRKVYPSFANVEFVEDTLEPVE